MSTPFVCIRNLSFAYTDSKYLFRDLSFDLAKGQCLGITGRSGGGKSTLAQVIAGHLNPLSGEVIVDGKNVTGQPGRQVFLVHQDSDLFPWLTVEQQIVFGSPQTEAKKIHELIQLTKLSGFEKHYPHQLSGGMKKRLAIARALQVNPKLLIFDESFSALDFELRMELFADLKEIWQNTQTTLILISHDPRDLEQIAQSELKLS